MKLPITIEYNDGVQATYVAAPPEWVKWEKHTGNTISNAQDKIGISDLVFTASAGYEAAFPGYKLAGQTMNDYMSNPFLTFGIGLRP